MLNVSLPLLSAPATAKKRMTAIGKALTETIKAFMCRSMDFHSSFRIYNSVTNAVTVVCRLYC